MLDPLSVGMYIGLFLGFIARYSLDSKKPKSDTYSETGSVPDESYKNMSIPDYYKLRNKNIEPSKYEYKQPEIINEKLKELQYIPVQIHKQKPEELNLEKENLSESELPPAYQIPRNKEELVDLLKSAQPHLNDLKIADYNMQDMPEPQQQNIDYHSG